MSKAISLKWVFGFTKQEPGLVHSLSDTAEITRLFFSAGNVGVIFEPPNKQLLLCGHGNRIVAASVCQDRSFVVTGDRCETIGNNEDRPEDMAPMIAMWDTKTGRSIFRVIKPHPYGVSALDVTQDDSIIATLSAPSPSTTTADGEGSRRQTVSLWKRGPVLATASVPITSVEIPVSFELSAIRFDPSNPSQLIATGSHGVVFLKHDRTQGKLIPVVPMMVSRSECLCSMFLPKNGGAVTSTADGDLILWEASSMRSLKSVHLHDAPIRVLETVGEKYLVTGADDGFVRFFDTQLRLLAWLERLGSGPISSLSFDNIPGDPLSTEFYAPHLLVATKSGLLKGVDPLCWEQRLVEGEQQGTTILSVQDGPVHAMAVSPDGQLLAIGGHSGLVQLWTLESKVVAASLRLESRLNVNCIAFTDDGISVAIGCTNGVVKLFSSHDLSEVPDSTWHYSKACITHLSTCSGFLATADVDRCVSLYRQDTPDSGGKWIYVSKYRSHGAPITSLLLVPPSKTTSGQTARLLSVGEDRRVVEYDLRQCSSSGGLAIKSTTEIEQEAIPTSACWLSTPMLPADQQQQQRQAEELLLTATNHFKLRLHNAHTKSCRKTALAPIFSGPIGRLVSVPGGQAVAFAAHERVIGLIALPIDGNPRGTAGMVGHPGQVANIVVSPDGRWLFTCGGPDQIVCAWRIDPTGICLASAATADPDKCSEADDPFAELLEGGREGQLFTDMVDYFRFAQIRAAGEASVEKYHIGPTIPLAQLPDVMRALGVFLSEREIEDLINEVKFSKYVETGAYVDTVTLPQLIRLYVNHKPVFGVTRELIVSAFKELGAAATDGRLPWNEVVLALQYKGETMNEDELRGCLDMLIGENNPTAQVLLSHPVGAKEFAEGILGFEDYS